MTSGMSIRLSWSAMALSLLVMTGGCSMLEGLGVARPSAAVVGVRPTDVSLTTLTLRFDVEVTNPYSVPLPLTSVDYCLASRGAQFLSGEAPLQGAVPANGSKVLPVPVKVDFINLLSVLADVRPGTTIPYDAELGLSVDAPVAGPLRLPMTKADQLDIPNIPSIRLP